MDFTAAEMAIGYIFRDKSLLERAFTLSSANRTENNQNLEFFGDAVLEFIVSERLFGECPDEGTMTVRRKSLVSDKALRPVSLKLGLDKFLIHGKNDFSNKKAVPSVYEAIVAAIYFDGGIQAAKNFVYATLDFNAAGEDENFKGALQEILQSEGKPRPEYIKQNTGTPQKPRFRITLNVSGKTFTGEAGKLKTAEQEAARAAVAYLKSRNKDAR